MRASQSTLTGGDTGIDPPSHPPPRLVLPEAPKSQTHTAHLWNARQRPLTFHGTPHGTPIGSQSPSRVALWALIQASPSKKATQKGGCMHDDLAANCWDIWQGSSTVQCIQDHAFGSLHQSPVPPRTHPRVQCWEPRPTFAQMSGSADPPKCQTLPRTPSLEYAGGSEVSNGPKNTLFRPELVPEWLLL